MSTAIYLPESSCRSIAAIASAITYFERARIFKPHAGINLGAELSRHASARSFGKAYVTTSVRNHSLRDVVVSADSLLLYQNGLAVPETAYFEPANAPRELPDHIESQTLSDADDIIFGYNNAHAGYQHWLTQCLPAIDWSLRQPRHRRPRLLLPRLQFWQEDFLNLLGYSEIQRLTMETGAYYRLPQIEYSEFLNGTTSFGVSLAVLETAKRILRAVPKSPSFATILYIPCANPYYGSIQNEDQVTGLMRSRGVHIVDTGLGTADRINLFRQADVVIGPHGQGLTDVVFCKPGALLWEWMPRHHQNASFNRLAQAAQVDYRGDLFETVAEAGVPGRWMVDIAAIAEGLSDIAARMIRTDTSAAAPSRGESDAVSQPLDDLMLRFESLGDNCEFGLVQRLCGAEPLGLLRFAGFYLPVEIRLQALVTALRRNFEGLGDAGTIRAYLAGEAGRREFLVREIKYDLLYHTFISEGHVDEEALRDAEVRRLGFLRRKLLEDLAAGEKIWVWRSHVTSDIEQVKPLLDVLRRLGPNTLLWVTEADDTHEAGTIEPIEPDFIRGYVHRFAPYTNATDIHLESWLDVCGQTVAFCDRVQRGREAPVRLSATLDPVMSCPAL